MLAISPAASAAIGAVLRAREVPDGAGLRLAAGAPTERGVAIEVTFVTAPNPSDQVIGTDSPADVLLESGTAELLADQVLDASQAPDGTVSFALHRQGPSTDDAGAGSAM